MTKDKNIFIKNVYYMLSYAFVSLKKDVYKDIAKEQFDHIYNLFAAILEKGIGFQLKQGLYREYANREENLPLVRGKIKMQGTIRNKLEHKMMIDCSYDELSENNLLNRIIKSTVFLLLKSSEVSSKYKDELKREMLFFDLVGFTDLQHVRWNEIRFQNNNRNYQVLIGVCQLIAEGCLLTTEKGEYHLMSFVDDQLMSRLYEKFILEYYKQEYEKIKGFSSSVMKIDWQLDDNNGELLPEMKTDITLKYGQKILIIDAKYYSETLQTNYDVQTIHSANLYQIFTYVKNKTVEAPDDEVAGMLLYAKTIGSNDINQNYQMSGNRISVKTLDLDQDFNRIKGSLDEVVSDYFGITGRNLYIN